MTEESAPARSRDAYVLRGAAAADPEAARLLLDEYLPTVYGFLYARVGGNEEVAADLLQETVLEGIRSAESFRGEAKLETWLCTIAGRRLARHFERERKEAVARSALSLVDADPGPQPDDEVIESLGRLSVLHRQVLVHKYLDDLSVEEIASLIGRTRVQVQSLLQRARDALRRELEEGHG